MHVFDTNFLFKCPYTVLNVQICEILANCYVCNRTLIMPDYAIKDDLVSDLRQRHW